MVRVLFVCLGNICRSPMAEFLLKHLAKERGCDDQLIIDSAATSREEIGNPVHSGTVKKLAEQHISCAGKRAIHITQCDWESYDYLLGMETSNLNNMTRILREADTKKIHRLLDFTEHPRDIADPWFTGNFEVTYHDIMEGCLAFLDDLEAKGLIQYKRKVQK
ncbi:low molecular weight protein-tyrosine-phosphatase [Clostridium merdae]|uniref:low molecular weight protein-tyrosine-phosphatase n=1 Tax=Clostridium merdae TaxID=1958780 RepID=UPI000A26BD1A|nr:low molecular weight protein-tyrosine-phosphatase [Clostridium merdae]